MSSSWEILQLYLQESDYCSVPAGSQDPISIFICPLRAPSIAVTESGFQINSKFLLFQANVCCCDIGLLCTALEAITLRVKLKLHFWALSLFKYCKISLPFVRVKDELPVPFLNYTGFSSKHRRMRVL